MCLGSSPKAPAPPEPEPVAEQISEGQRQKRRDDRQQRRRSGGRSGTLLATRTELAADASSTNKTLLGQ